MAVSVLQQYTTGQHVAIIIVSKCSACLSMIGSLSILYKILQMPRRKVTTKERLIAGMSVFDTLGSICWLIGTWAFPKSMDVWGASGSDQTCRAQGFVFMLSYAVLLYQMALGVYFLARTKRSVKARGSPQGFCSKFIIPEPVVHGMIISYASLGAVLGLAFDAIHAKGVICMVVQDPDLCDPEDVNCKRNLSGPVFFLGSIFVLIPLLITLLVGAVCMTLLYRHVCKVEERMEKYTVRESNENDSTQFQINASRYSSLVGWQGFWYMGALLVCWIPALIYNILLSYSPPGSSYFVAHLLQNITNPCQGFFNILVYSRGMNQTMAESKRRHEAMKMQASDSFSNLKDYFKSAQMQASDSFSSLKDYFKSALVESEEKEANQNQNQKDPAKADEVSDLPTNGLVEEESSSSDFGIGILDLSGNSECGSVSDTSELESGFFEDSFGPLNDRQYKQDCQQL
jgi:hypothetical protein